MAEGCLSGCGRSLGGYYSTPVGERTWTSVIMRYTQLDLRDLRDKTDELFAGFRGLSVLEFLSLIYSIQTSTNRVATGGYLKLNKIFKFYSSVVFQVLSHMQLVVTLVEQYRYKILPLSTASSIGSCWFG